MLFMLLFSRQGKLRLQKWYVAHPDKVKKKITRELITTILARYVYLLLINDKLMNHQPFLILILMALLLSNRKPKMCSFLEWKDCKIVYKR